MHVRISETNTFKRHPHSHQHHRSRGRRRRRCRRSSCCRCRQCPRCSHNLLAQHECWTFGIHSQQQSRAIRELLWLMLHTESYEQRALHSAYVQRATPFTHTLHWSNHTKYARLCACVANFPSTSVIVLSEFFNFYRIKIWNVWWDRLSFNFPFTHEKKVWHICIIMCASYGLVKFQFSMMREGIRLLVVHTSCTRANFKHLPGLFSRVL